MNSVNADFGRAGEVVLNLSDEELEDISGGSWYVTGKDVDLYNCPGHSYGGGLGG